MAEFADRASFSNYFLPDLFDEEVRKAVQKAVSIGFKGQFIEAMDLLDGLEKTASPDQVAVFIEGPVYPALLFKLAQQAGDPQTAEQMRDIVRARGGNLVWCFNDLAVLLAERGDFAMAADTLAALHRDAPDDLTVLANLLSVSVVTGMAAQTAETAKAFAARSDGLAEMVAKGTDPKFGPYRRLSGSIISNVTGAFVRYGRQKATDDAISKTLENVFDAILGILDGLPDPDRDTYLAGVLEAVRWDKAAIVAMIEDGRLAPSRTVALLRAALAFQCVEPDAEARFREIAPDDKGRIALYGLALLAGEAGRLEEERRLIEQLLERDPTHSRPWFYLGSNRFRAGDLPAANAAAAKAIERSSGPSNEMIAIAKAQSQYLRKAIVEGIPERWPEIDPYADVEWALNYWEKYLFDFEHLSYRQDNTTFLNKTYIETIGEMLERDPAISTVFNFGAFCGKPDYDLARLHPGLTVIGFDRDKQAIAESGRRFVAPNLKFLAGDLADALGEIPAQGRSVMVHIRTCTTLYPEGVRRVYAAAAKAGIDYILGIETTGFSYQTVSWPDFSDPDQEPVVPLGVMVDHHYPNLLAEAGYTDFQQDLLLYPYLMPATVNPEAQTPRRFIASGEGTKRR
jgi:tetratricopeptide (TPR) repeat protein